MARRLRSGGNLNLSMSISIHNPLEPQVSVLETGRFTKSRPMPAYVCDRNDGVPLEKKVAESISRSQNFLFSIQNEDGHWVGEMLVDVTLVADFIALMHGLDDVDLGRQVLCVNHILSRQSDDGGWGIYPGGPSEINATVKAYFGLKLAGFSSNDARLIRARNVIAELGGIGKANTYTKIHLALFGQYPWHRLPAIPVELILLPNWFCFNIYEMSSWSRAMVVPISILHHFKSVQPIAREKGIHELYPEGTDDSHLDIPFDRNALTIKNVFLLFDKAIKLLDSFPWRPFRRKALDQAEMWILERITTGSDGLATLFPCIMYTLMVLDRLGYGSDHPMVRKCHRDLEHLLVTDTEKNEFRVQPCVSPVWDTAITSVSLVDSGIEPNDERLQRSADWLISKEISQFRGDWRHKNPVSLTSGWAFEYNNKFYPDVDDTFEVLIALSAITIKDELGKGVVMERALKWATSFQCANGGYAAFDKNITQKILEFIPFADHNAILDPPCSDITARALEAFGRMGYDRELPEVSRAIRFLKKSQLPDGPWEARWGVNYIYGTWLVLRGLKIIGEPMNQQWVVRGRKWLESCQNADGGWGESPASYESPELKGKGESTASQTAWALMGLMAASGRITPYIRRGVEYLCRTQNPDGSWTENHSTGTGFPRVFYMKYDMYRNNWPLLALGDFDKLLHAEGTRS